MEKKTTEEKEALFTEYLQKPPYPVDEMIALIDDAPAAKADDWTGLALTAFAEAQDFESAFKLVRARRAALAQKASGSAIRDALRRTTRDRLQIAYIDSVGFDVRPLNEALGRLERLLGFHPGALVLNQAWGLGTVKRMDYFYRRITVDFRLRKGHQLTFDAACETLVPAPENHILVTAKADPDRVAKMLKDEPGEFVKAMLSSFGDMPITRLEELADQNGFVKSANWKQFWERARAELRQDKLVEIPSRRAEPLHLKATAETYGEGWFTAFAQMSDPKSILSSVRELQGVNKLKGLTEENRAKLSNRLAFALKGARGVDDALYARIAFCMDELKLDAVDKEGNRLDVVSKARAYLWDGNRYLAAARSLPAREMESLVVFLTAADRESTKKTLFAALPEMCFPLLTATLTFFANDADCEDACAALLRDPAAPATLVTYMLARYEQFAHWKKLPELVVILTHAIAIGEGRQSGEVLRMQNTIRRLFADQKWLEGIFKQLQPADQALLFERFQASTAWDPSTHHLIVVRMTRLAPGLTVRQVKKAVQEVVERITSLRSYAERKAAYQKLVNVDIPKNAHDIDVARSYGDLRENFEYQSAKDEQRALLQKQTIMQEELNAVKAFDFAGVEADKVRPGVSVKVRNAAGEELVYTVLGEWDNDLSRNIISNKTRLAQNLMGKKPGDTFDLPDAEGNASTATIVAIEKLTDELLEWTKVPAGLSI
jgi:transcription elongation GreA/GreB family factor